MNFWAVCSGKLRYPRATCTPPMQSSPTSPVRQWAELVEDDIGDVGERRADGDGLPRPQTLAARVGARLGGAVGVDDLPSAPGPGLHERVGEGFARRHDVAA